MKKVLLLLSLLLSFNYAQQTIRVATYNILNYAGTQRNAYLRTVTQEINADMLIVQEILTQQGVDSFAVSVLQNNYATIPFEDGPDTDNHMFYKADKLDFVAATYLSTTLREIALYIMRENSSNELIYFFSAHLKASQGEENEARRLEEVTVLYNYLIQLSDNTNYMLAGDLNVYYSNEPAYQKLIVADEYERQLFDPIDTPGGWHNSFTYAGIHTQSPRLDDIGDGGSTGGLDDRFDFILISEALIDNYIPGTYTSFGNDGLHFNQNINNGQNNAVDEETADALFYGSDHLPVYCDFSFGPVSALDEVTSSPRQFTLYSNYPNPFNGSTTIHFYLPQTENIEIDLYNSAGSHLGKLFSGSKTAGEHKINISLDHLASGIYYSVFKSESANRHALKMVLIK